MAPYATPQDLANYLRGDVDTANAELLLAGITAAVVSFIGWDVASGSYTDRVDSHGGSLLALRTLHLTGVTSVLDASGAPTTGYTWSETGTLCRRDGWNCGQGAYTVAYTGGYETIPKDLQLVTLSMAARLQRVSGGVQQEVSTAGGRTESRTYFALAGDQGSGFTAVERAVLDRYRLPPEVA